MLEKIPTEKEVVKVEKLDDFDKEYFYSIAENGKDEWIALGSKDYENQNYFTAIGVNNEKIGIIGVYDSGEEKNVTHVVVDPKYRGQRLAGELQKHLMNKLGLDFITLTIDLDNEASIKAAEKMTGIKKVSDKEYEEKYHKVKYIYEKLKK